MSIEAHYNEEYLRGKLDYIKLQCEKLIAEAEDQLISYQDEAAEAMRQIERINTKIAAYNQILNEVIK